MKHIENKKVGELMTYGVVTVPDYSKLIDIIKIFTEGHIHSVVVVGKEGKASGIVSEIDISKAFGHEVGEVNAEEIMSTPVKTIDMNATISEAAKIMREEGFGRLVVLDEKGFPRGILSITDIIKELLRAYSISYR